jgi:hypothetical protein
VEYDAFLWNLRVIYGMVDGEREDDGQALNLSRGSDCSEVYYDIDYYIDVSFKELKEVDKNCIICYDDFEESQQIVKLVWNVNHVFHKDCILKWMKTHHSCPICRTRLIPEDNNSEEEKYFDSDNSDDLSIESDNSSQYANRRNSSSPIQTIV